MASVFPKDGPKPANLENTADVASWMSYIRIDNELDIVACSGPLFEAEVQCKTSLEVLLGDWFSDSGANLNLVAACENVRKNQTTFSYLGAKNNATSEIGHEISIIPQYSEKSALLTGISILFRPEQPTSKYPPSADNYLKNGHQELGDDHQALLIALQTSRVTSWQFFPQDAGRLEILGAWSEQTGHRLQTNLGSFRKFIALVHPDDRSILESFAGSFKAADTDTFEIEYRLRNKQGIYEFILSRGKVIERDNNGLALRVIGTSTDINELKRYESRLNLALENGRQGFWEWSHDGSVKLSTSWHGLFGYEPDEIARLTPDFSKLIHPDDYKHTSTSFDRLIREPEHVHRVEYRLRHKLGHYLWVADQGATIERDMSGKAQKIIGSMVDITAHRNALQETKNAREFLQQILDEIPDPIFWKDNNYEFLGCNKSYSTLMGFDNPQDVVGKKTHQLYEPESARIYEKDDDRILQNGISIVKEERLTTNPQGQGFWIEFTKLPLALKTGDANSKTGVLCHFREITQERARRKQLESLADIMSGDLGERRLDRLVAGTAELTGAEAVFVGRYNQLDGSITVVASHAPENRLEGLSYSIEGTPCASVLQDDITTFNSNVQNDFPNHSVLSELDIASYAGRKLLDNQGETVGIFVLMSRASIENFDQAASLLDIVSSTATYELIRETRENTITESEKRYRNIYDSVPVMICTTDENHNIRDINSTWIETTGYIHADIVGKPLNNLFNTQNQLVIQENIRKAWQGQECHRDGYLHLIASNGSEVVVSHNAVHTTSSGSGGMTINVFEDMREQFKSAQQLRLAAIAFETHEALVIRDGERRVLRANEAFTRVTGFSLAEILDLDFDYFTPAEDEDVRQLAIIDGKWQGNGTCRRADGGSFNAYQTVTAVKDDSGDVTHYVENFNDITDYVEALAETERLAYFDSLTELPNRRQLSERLQESLSAATRHKSFGAVMFVDLDHFKNINDAVGHSVGDLVLQQVAKRLLRILRVEDTVARLGGDEFVVLISNISLLRDDAERHASQIAGKIQRELRKPYLVGDHEFHITPTIGVTLFPEDEDTVDDVLKQADAAMYRAKAEGRDQSKFYNESMQDGARERLLVEKDLRKAAVNNELFLVFQPQLSGSGKIFGAEALLRWKHPTRGLVSPVDFIPIAEETGLILEIGKWVLNEAFGVLAAWEQRPFYHQVEHLSVNVSSRQFGSQDFVEDVARRLAHHGADPKKVVLEVTESTVIDKIQATVSKMEELRKLGFRFSVDDFGTGYSSLAYLSRLPLDQLKIDRTFVSNIHDPANAVIVETILAMGRHLGLQTVAEGVETLEQLSFLNARECNAYQGYYFAKPLSRVDFENYLIGSQSA